MISRLLALPSVRVLPKIMGPWTEHSIPHERPAWSASAPWLPWEWTLFSIYTKEVWRFFFFPLLIFFSLLSSCIIRRAHMKFAVKSNYQMLLTNETFHTYSSLTSGSHQGQGTQVCHHTREGQNVEGNLLYTGITKSLVNASPND